MTRPSRPPASSASQRDWSCAFVAVLLVAALASSHPPHVQGAELDKTVSVTCDFGNIIAKRPYTKLIDISDRLPRGFEITRVRACGGVVAKAVADGDVPASRSGHLRLTLTASGACQALRNVTYVHVTQGPRQFIVALWITAKAVWPIEAEPEKIDAGGTLLGATWTQSIVLRSNVPEHVRIDSVRTGTARTVATVVQATGPGAKLRIERLPETSLGSYHDYVVVATSHPVKTHINIPIDGVALSRMRVRPSALYLGVIRKPEHAEALLHVWPHDPTFKLSLPRIEIKPNVPAHIDVQPAAAGKQGYTVTIRFDRQPNGSEIAGGIFLRTDQPDVHPISVSFYGVFDIR